MGFQDTNDVLPYRAVLAHRFLTEKVEEIAGNVEGETLRLIVHAEKVIPLDTFSVKC